jgi:hypothetical protein
LGVTGGRYSEIYENIQTGRQLLVETLRNTTVGDIMKENIQKGRQLLVETMKNRTELEGDIVK